ncbi:hypothetical protein [Feifania hominis]|uniref:Uncharacterized protein n=1 Tax=Feifania hominis TaxID=2763660 RepID=A0A926DC37_9FIRM|nr:hypothetical protein [Feifania hominis]MBC8535486.1 hypothetical protein [Feifania hominis]
MTAVLQISQSDRRRFCRLRERQYELSDFLFWNVSLTLSANYTRRRHERWLRKLARRFARMGVDTLIVHNETEYSFGAPLTRWGLRQLDFEQTFAQTKLALANRFFEILPKPVSELTLVVYDRDAAYADEPWLRELVFRASRVSVICAEPERYEGFCEWALTERGAGVTLSRPFELDFEADVLVVLSGAEGIVRNRLIRRQGIVLNLDGEYEPRHDDPQKLISPVFEPRRAPVDYAASLLSREDLLLLLTENLGSDAVTVALKGREGELDRALASKLLHWA